MSNWDMEMGKQMRCRKCGSFENKKFGTRKGKQCYFCKNCKFQFTVEEHGHSEVDEKVAIVLYCLGLSFRTIGQALSYHHTSVMRWIMDFAKRHYHKPVPKEEIFLELDEMWHFLESKKTNCGSGRHIQGMAHLLIGNVVPAPQRLLKGCITA